MSTEMADPGQDARDAPDVASLWTILDLTPEGAWHELVSKAELLNIKLLSYSNLFHRILRTDLFIGGRLV